MSSFRRDVKARFIEIEGVRYRSKFVNGQLRLSSWSGSPIGGKWRRADKTIRRLVKGSTVPNKSTLLHFMHVIKTDT